MAVTYTKNYNFPKPGIEENFDSELIGTTLDMIDEECKRLSDKADTIDVNDYALKEDFDNTLKDKENLTNLVGRYKQDQLINDLLYTNADKKGLATPNTVKIIKDTFETAKLTKYDFEGSLGVHLANNGTIEKKSLPVLPEGITATLNKYDYIPVGETFIGVPKLPEDKNIFWFDKNLVLKPENPYYDASLQIENFSALNSTYTENCGLHFGGNSKNNTVFCQCAGDYPNNVSIRVEMTEYQKLVLMTSISIKGKDYVIFRNSSMKPIVIRTSYKKGEYVKETTNLDNVTTVVKKACQDTVNGDWILMTEVAPFQNSFLIYTKDGITYNPVVLKNDSVVLNKKIVNDFVCIGDLIYVLQNDDNANKDIISVIKHYPDDTFELIAQYEDKYLLIRKLYELNGSMIATLDSRKDSDKYDNCDVGFLMLTEDYTTNNYNCYFKMHLTDAMTTGGSPYSCFSSCGKFHIITDTYHFEISPGKQTTRGLLKGLGYSVPLKGEV